MVVYFTPGQWDLGGVIAIGVGRAWSPLIPTIVFRYPIYACLSDDYATLRGSTACREI